MHWQMNTKYKFICGTVITNTLLDNILFVRSKDHLLLEITISILLNSVSFSSFIMDPQIFEFTNISMSLHLSSEKHFQFRCKQSVQFTLSNTFRYKSLHIGPLKLTFRSLRSFSHDPIKVCSTPLNICKRHLTTHVQWTACRLQNIKLVKWIKICDILMTWLYDHCQYFMLCNISLIHIIISDVGT